eukprot:TRINITY_DN3506_c0_g3_i3.p1 TRINITY_DN3506_c0_g3~~TRINITY_DN3506_c0_g3_i3.p1  ORF type:complete len:593 (-),score=188.34 TRINITY_DN3506_c0_g3_i3:161-1939(-)
MCIRDRYMGIKLKLMPTIHVSRAYFFKLLGKQLTFEELENLAFEYGIEVEEEVEEGIEKLKFELGANRYDLLCVEGLVLCLGTFLGLRKPPVYAIKNAEGARHKLIVKPATRQIRPYVVGAVLRNVKFDQDSYDSFIDLQDKLHHNIGRKRTLVAIGTHDLDTVSGPFIYDARAPKDISFVPLNQTEAMDGERLMAFYANDQKLKAFLPIIEKSPVYPVIVDSQGTVLSLPPIINGDHSKIKLATKNVFIESTATDLTKAKAALAVIVGAFSLYAGDQFTVEEVEVHYEANPEWNYVTPDVTPRTVEVSVNYVNELAGIKIDAAKAAELVSRMSLGASIRDQNTIVVSVPLTRSDILHPCDVVEDIAVSYGYNNITEVLPPSATVGGQQFINKMSDYIRLELASTGYREVLNFGLNSKEELSKFLNRPLDANVVHIGNPKSADFQVVRNTLIPGIMKSLTSNITNKLPISIFEVGDVVLKDESTETGARNERRLVALQAHQFSSGFEFIHGLLDYIMGKLKVRFDAAEGYAIRESNNPTFFEGRQAEVTFKGRGIGTMGILHPLVLEQFKWPYPVSLLEINLGPLVETFSSH